MRSLLHFLLVCVFANKDRVCLKATRAVVFKMAMGNPNTQQRLDQLEQEMEKLKELFPNQIRMEVAAALGIVKKQESIDRTLAILIEGQAKLIEIGIQSEGNWRRHQSAIQEKQNVEWADRRDVEQDLEKTRDLFSEQIAAMEGRMLKKQEATDKTLAQLGEEQMRMLEKKGTRSYSHMGCQEFSCDQRKQKARRKKRRKPLISAIKKRKIREGIGYVSGWTFQSSMERTRSDG